MKSKHNLFLAKYFSEKDRRKQFEMMKQYMLSLDLEDLNGFISEQIKAVKSLWSEEKLSVSEKKEFKSGLDKIIGIVKEHKAVQTL